MNLISGVGFQASGFRVSSHCQQKHYHQMSSPGSQRANRFRVSCFVFRVSGSGFRVPGSGVRVSCFVFRVSGFGFRVRGSGFRVPGSGFRVSCSGFRGPGVLSGLQLLDAERKVFRV
jgi:hypothetical protein